MLDIGSGRAEMAAGFVQHGLKVTATDASSEAAEFARKAGAGFHQFQVAPDKKLPFPDDSFDIVFCKSFVEHLREPVPFAVDCLRVLRPGGRVIFLTPDWESNHKIFFDDVTHVTPFTTQTMSQLLEIGGFEKVTSYRFRQLPLTWRHPQLNVVSSLISPFIPVRTKNKFLRWSRELIVCGTGVKQNK
jgi:SAM-dependent methyltransferase